MKEKKKALKTDKNQLLDYVEETIQKQQEEEKTKQQMKDDIASRDSVIKQV